MSESDLYRRQILTYKDGPRAERVNKHTFRYLKLAIEFAIPGLNSATHGLKN